RHRRPYIIVFSVSGGVAHQFLVLDAYFARRNAIRLLFYNKKVGGNLPGHYAFAQTVDSFNDYLASVRREGFDGEHDAGGLRGHHALYRNGDAHLEVV